jgi:hypothetical protein
VREALERAAPAAAARLVSMRLLAPVRRSSSRRRSPACARVLVVEQNHGAQFHRYLRAHYDLPGRGAQPSTAPARCRSVRTKSSANWPTGPAEHGDRMKIHLPELTARRLQVRLQADLVPGLRRLHRAGSITKALAELRSRRTRSAVVSGIGCSSRIPAYTTCYGFHGVHGRALAAATG